jgi:hypothetical protein
MRRHCVTEAYGIDIILVPGDAQYRLTAFDVVYIDRVVSCARNDLTAVTGEADRPDLDLSASAHINELKRTYTKVCVEATRIAGANVGKIKKIRFCFVLWVCRR